MHAHLRNIIILAAIFCGKQSFAFNKRQGCGAFSKQIDVDCTFYCYKVVKPILEYAAYMRPKEQQFDELQKQVSVLEVALENLKETIKYKELLLLQQTELTNIYREKDLLHQKHVKSNKMLENVMNEKRMRLQEKEISINKQELFNSKLQLVEKPNNPIARPYVEIFDAQNVVVDPLTTEGEIGKSLANNCLNKPADIYFIKVPDMTLFPVYCDNGWIVVQRRINGSENFHRNWRAYKEGFGNVRGEFFIGLEKLHHLTTMRTHELRIILEDFWGNVRHAQYSEFLIGDENESYELKQLGEYSGNADDALRSHKHAKFSTPDHTDQLRHCAQIYKAGWWFNDDCYQCNLNGRYHVENIDNAKGIEWRTWHFKPLKAVQMMIRPKLNIK